MISLFFSSASRKAWVAGLVAALLTPIHDLLSSDGEITLRTVLVAVLSGILTATVTFGVSNTDAPVDDTPGEHAADRSL